MITHLVSVLLLTFLQPISNNDKTVTKHKGKLQGCAILYLCQGYWGDMRFFQLKRGEVYMGGQKISCKGGGEGGDRFREPFMKPCHFFGIFLLGFAKKSALEVAVSTLFMGHFKVVLTCRIRSWQRYFMQCTISFKVYLL